MENIKILGEGWYNIVLMPPILCDTTIPPNSVGKIGSYEILKREYDFIMQYIKFSKTFAQYVNAQNTFMCKINYNELPEHIKNDLKRRDNPEYELIMPYLGKTFDTYISRYKNNCKNNKIYSEIIPINIFVNYIVAIDKLFRELIMLNDNGFYHNDIKPNNLIYNEYTNSLILIDFNLSIIKNIPQYYVHQLSFNQKYIDLYNLIQLVLLNIMEVSFTNKYIYDNFVNIYTNIKKYIKQYVLQVEKGGIEVTTVDIQNIKTSFIKYMDDIMTIVNKLNTAQIIDENIDTTYCNIDKDIKMPAIKQKEYAKKWITTQNLMKSEQINMFAEDKKGGLKKKHLKHTKTKKRKKNKKHSKTKRVR